MQDGIAHTDVYAAPNESRLNWYNLASYCRTDAMSNLRVRAVLALFWVCLLLPILESHAFLHRTAPFQDFFGLHGGTALALVVMAFVGFHTEKKMPTPSRPQWQGRFGLLIAAMMDVAMQWYQGSDYLLSSMLQPFHVIALGVLVWSIIEAARQSIPSFGAQVLVVGAPLIVFWGVAATWSPFIAVYADQYGGGDTLVSHGATCIMVFVATLVLTLNRASTQNAPRWCLIAVIGVFGICQGLMADSWRFVPLLLGTGLTYELLSWRWPHAQRMLTLMTVAVWIVGYFATLHFTTMIAWDLTTWLGVCILGILLAAILATLRYKPTEVTL
jgi:hypothetical protein